MRFIQHAVVVAFIAVPLLTGCGPDPNAQIQTLEQERGSLQSQLADAQRRRQEAEGALSQRDQELAALRRANEELQGRLAAAPEQEPKVVEPGWQPVKGGVMIAIDETVLFQSGKAILRDEAKRTLDKIATTLNGTYGGKDILVVGHTDDQPIQKSGWKDNYELSCQRSLAVVRYLAGKSVDPGRMVAGGCGEHRNKVSNTNAANRQANRRVEIFAMDVALGK
ncbi:MAG: OmpA family protein [Phycisphaerales bacterium]|nr:OmpA family protein [Phycisphaerales bacterium]